MARMRERIVPIAILTVCAVLPAVRAAAVVPSAFDKVFVGRLGDKYDVRVVLTRDAATLSGQYSYVHVADSLLKLQGRIDDHGAFSLDESDSGKKTGLFKGTLGETASGLLQIAGTWSKRDGTKPLAFTLPEEHFDVDGAAVRYEVAALKEANEKARWEINLRYPRLEGSAKGVEGFNARARAIADGWAAEFKKNLADVADMPKPVKSSSAIDSLFTFQGESAGVVSVRLTAMSYFEGAAHPSHPVATLTYDLRAGKEVALGDVFAPGSDYLGAIAAFCLKKLAHDDLATGEWAAGAAPKAENYARWNLTPEGLLITFDEYQVGPYAVGQPEVLVPRADLVAVARKGGPLASPAR
jgi:hypothetical protein